MARIYQSTARAVGTLVRGSTLHRSFIPTARGRAPFLAAAASARKKPGRGSVNGEKKKEQEGLMHRKFRPAIYLRRVRAARRGGVVEALTE